MKVITVVVNNPDFIRIQHHTLKKYLKCEYEFIVFNDAKKFPDLTNFGDITLITKLTDVCEELGIQHISIPNDHHDVPNPSASARHADSCNFMTKYMFTNPDKYLMLDSDMFLIDDFNPLITYKDCFCAIVKQERLKHRLEYIWPNFFYLDTTCCPDQHMINWNCGNGGDSGGMMRDWLAKQLMGQKAPSCEKMRFSKSGVIVNNIYFMPHLWSNQWDESEYPTNLGTDLLSFLKRDPRNRTKDKFRCELYDSKFLHYSAGSNWTREGRDIQQQLTEKLKELLIR